MFRIGQKIVCIKVNPLRTLEKDKVYTVTDVRPETGGVKLAEVIATDVNRSGYFDKNRFKEIDLDEDFAENILSEIIKQVQSEELVRLN